MRAQGQLMSVITLMSHCRPMGFDHFGFQSLSAQNDKNAVPTYNYGQWLLNGSATVTGSVYIWPAK